MDWKYEATKIADDYGIPKDLFLGLIKAESHWNPYVVSSQGAIGLTQVMPNTALSMGYNPSELLNNPTLQLEAGAKYLSLMYETFEDWTLSVTAYNTGPDAVNKYGGIPPFKGTQNFVQKVFEYAKEYKK